MWSHAGNITSQGRNMVIQAWKMSYTAVNMSSQTGTMSSQTGTMSSKSRNMVNQVGNMTSQVWTLLVRQRTKQIKLGKYQVKTCLYCLEEAWWLRVDGWFFIRLKISQGWSTGLLDDGGDITDSIWLWDVINICIYHCTCFYAALSPISHFYYNYACLWQTYTVIWPLYRDTVHNSPAKSEWCFLPASIKSFICYKNSLLKNIIILITFIFLFSFKGLHTLLFINQNGYV